MSDSSAFPPRSRHRNIQTHRDPSFIQDLVSALERHHPDGDEVESDLSVLTADDIWNSSGFIPDYQTWPDDDQVPISGIETKDTNPKDAIGVAKAYQSTIPRPVIWEVGLAMLEGALKYGRHNYRKAGVRTSVYYDAFMRHLDAYWEGEDIDPMSGLSHITKAIAGLIVFRDAMMNDLVTDDRPPRPANPNWLEELNQKAKDLLDQYPIDIRKTPYTNTEHGPVAG